MHHGKNKGKQSGHVLLFDVFYPIGLFITFLICITMSVECDSGKNYEIARNCLTSTFKIILMQMRGGNSEKRLLSVPLPVTGGGGGGGGGGGEERVEGSGASHSVCFLILLPLLRYKLQIKTFRWPGQSSKTPKGKDK